MMRVRPVGVVDQRRLERTGLEVEQLGQLHLDALDVVPQRVVVEQVALLAAATRVADHAGGAAGQRERTVTGELEAAHEQLADEVADVQRVGRRIEPDVQADVALGQPGSRARRGRWCRESSPRASRSASRSIAAHHVARSPPDSLAR